MKIGVSVVYLDPKAGWVPGVVEDVTGFGEKTMVKIEGKKYGVDQVCEVMDKGVLGECPEDVMDLGMLHEGIVFCALRNVYLTGQCCTRLGKDIVIVVNPYTYKLPEGPLYDHKHYKKPPHHHPFSLARRAYKSLARASTSIVVTGESGAGKTETTKALLGYLSVKTGKEVRRRVMDAMLLLEVIGNAKTEKNDNSSRFGKYITLLFDGENHLKGAKLSTYLLEVSRVVSHGVLDRNFHVFYALLKGNEGIKTQLLGPDTRPQDFKCVNPGTTNLVRNVDDHENFKIITKSLNDLGVTHAVQITGFWSIVASIMHLLNITFRPAKRNDGSEVVDHVHVEKAATLLGVSPDGLLKTLTTTTMRAPGESEMITSGLSVVKAEATRNGIAKFLYKSLFDWVVSLVNEQLKPVGPVRSTTISLLDLFGFENFGENFLEQFLINYANESLQHHYNTQLFMAMTSACKAQSVSFKIAKHVSNAKCIDLIESRTGILRTLEDECALSGLKSSDSSYLEKLYASYTGPQGQRLNPYFNKPKVASEPWDFIVTHYAGDVRYKVTGSIEKNKHPVKDEVVKFLGSSGNEGTKRVVASNRSVSTTLLSREFKEELNNLLDVVAETETLWVRCVKPNTSKRPNLFEGDEVYRQLHCNGIVSTVKLLESGPQMTSFHTFTARYGCLYPPYTREASPRDQCLSIQHHLNIPQSDLQVGTLSDVFLTTAAYTKLTHLRESLKQNATDTLKRVYLGLLGRQEVFVEHAAREAIRLEEEKEAQLKRDEEAWTVVDNQRRKQEAFTAKQRAAGLKYASGRLATCARIEADRKAYYSKAHKQLSLWSRFVENDLTAWEGKEAQWSAKDAEADRIKAGIIKKHTETHQQRMDEIRQKAGEQAKLMETTKKREETVRRAAIEARKEQYRQRELLKKKEELRREEEAARRKALRDLKDSKLEADSEARYKQMLKKERAEKNSALRRETLAAQEEAYLQQQFRRKTRTASTGNTKQQWKTQQEIWSKMEVEEAQRYLSQGPQTDRVSPYASTIHRDVNETFGSYW